MAEIKAALDMWDKTGSFGESFFVPRSRHEVIRAGRFGPDAQRPRMWTHLSYRSVTPDERLVVVATRPLRRRGGPHVSVSTTRAEDEIAGGRCSRSVHELSGRVQRERGGPSGRDFGGS